MKGEHVQVIGFLLLVYSCIMLFSFISLLFRKKAAFIIFESYLVDNSKFESLGRISFDEISTVNKVKNNTLEIVFKEPFFILSRLNILKNFMYIANNWNFKNSFFISSAILNCDIDELENAISRAMKKYFQDNNGLNK